MGQPVQNGAGEALCSEDLGLFVEGQVRGDDDGATFVALKYDLEEQFGAGFAEGNEAQLVDDQQFLAGELFLQTLQAPFIGSLDQLMHQGGGGGEADLQALLADRQSEAEGDMGLAGSAWGNRNHAPIDLRTSAA